MDTTKRIVATLSAGFLGLALNAAAQSTTGTSTSTTATTTGTTTPAKRSVRARQARQQQRIGEGVENGSLTAKEAGGLEKKESRLQNEKKEMKEDGSLSPAEKAKLEKQENNLSKDIYKQKHDAQHQPKAKGEVESRDRNQQKRIGEGIENGSLTAKEAAGAESNEAKLLREEHKDRQANGGTLTAAEKAKVNRQQNRLSKGIYKQKHDAQRRGKH